MCIFETLRLTQFGFIERELGIQLFGYGMILASLYCIFGHWRKTQLVKKSQNWPAAEGEITHSSVERRNSGSYGQNNRVYVADIFYTYFVNGIERTGKTICIGGELDTSFSERAEERCRQYPVGAKASIFYDPNNEKYSCLEKRGKGGWLTMLIGIVFLAVGSVIVLQIF